MSGVTSLTSTIATLIVAPPPTTALMIFDNVPPRESEIGLGVTVGIRRSGAGTFFGASLQRERGYGYEPVGTLTKQAVIGRSTNNGDVWLAATAGKIYFTVENSDEVVLTAATLAEITAGKNNFFIGREKIGVQTPTYLGSNVWKGENLVRGLNHTEIFQGTHTAAEDVILLDENIYFIPIERRDMNTTLLFKAVSFGLTLGVVAAVSLACRGDSVRSYTVDGLAAFRDSSTDWDISAVGNPRDSERPESYVASLHRLSTGVFLRNIPIVPGIRMAAILGHVIHASGGGTWSVSTHAAISKNDVIGELNPTAAYVTQPFALGGEINARVTVTPPPIPFLSGNVKLSFGPKDFTDPFGVITGASFANVGNSITTTRINVFDWSTSQFAFLDLPTVGGVVFVRVVWSGTELRWQFSGSPINAAAKPDVILKDIVPVSSTFLRVSLINGGPSGASASKVENITIGGLTTPRTIYTLSQQQNDNAGNAIAVGDLDVEFWQVSPSNPPDFKGFPVRKTF
jgi:hypothetical protein